MNTDIYTITSLPSVKSILIFADGFQIHMTCEVPNFFWRLMHYLCFGFKWKSVE